jgi:hypothetical protein
VQHIRTYFLILTHTYTLLHTHTHMFLPICCACKVLRAGFNAAWQGQAPEVLLLHVLLEVYDVIHPAHYAEVRLFMCISTCALRSVTCVFCLSYVS